MEERVKQAKTKGNKLAQGQCSQSYVSKDGAPSVEEEKTSQKHIKSNQKCRNEVRKREAHTKHSRENADHHA